MNKFILLFTILVTFNSCKPDSDPKDRLHQQFDSDLDVFALANQEFLKSVQGRKSVDDLRREFLELRLKYKRTEAFAEYFTPTTVRLVNGAPLDEIEDEENAVFEPGGLQVIEELVYADEPLEQDALEKEVRKMGVNVKRIKMLWKDIHMTDSHVFDALRLEIFRLIALGISGFDTPASGNALAETVEVLTTFEKYLDVYQNRLSEYKELKGHIGNAIAFVKKEENFNDFDRASFIVDHLNPITRSLKANQELAAIPFIKDRRLLKSNAATFFDPDIFDPDAILSNTKFSSTADRVTLGQKLFFDGRISGNGKTNCGSCHNPELAYTDGLKTSKGISQANIKRNAPTIMYASLQQSFFYDLRSPTLEDQAVDVIHNKDEMHGSLASIAKLVGSDKDYQLLFKRAYPELDSIQPVYIQNALATYVRSQNPFNSPFDHFMRGDKKALTDSQVKGFNLFMGKAKCGTCHFVPLFNGTIPPGYQKTESEVLGTTKNANWKHAVLDDDKGRGVHDQFPQWANSFKTSTLRNISATAPYMHNGAYSSLQEVMEFYNEGGGAGLGLDVPNQTLAPDKLNLSEIEMKQIIEFMEGLTDRAF